MTNLSSWISNLWNTLKRKSEISHKDQWVVSLWLRILLSTRSILPMSWRRNFSNTQYFQSGRYSRDMETTKFRGDFLSRLITIWEFPTSHRRRVFSQLWFTLWVIQFQIWRKTWSKFLTRELNTGRFWEELSSVRLLQRWFLHFWYSTILIW